MSGLDDRQRLKVNSWLQLVAVVLTMVFLNLLGQKEFTRADLTADRVHSLSQAGRVLMARLDRPLVVKVFFTRGLEAPYNNHEQILTDKLEEFRAWSRGRMELSVVDPTGDKELEEEAQRLGIQPIQYTFRSDNRSELRQVYMGAAFIYGERQTMLPAITQVDTVEYDIARSVKSLIDGERKTLGYLTGHDEPDLLTARGPLEKLREELLEAYDLRPVALGTPDGIPEDVDALWIIGPQGELGLAEQYELDQLLMAGKPIAFFLTNYKPDLRTMRTIPVRHGLEPLLGAYGVELNRDLVADRVSNGKMRFPVRQGRYVVQLPINYPLIPETSDLAEASPVVKDLDVMQFPFVSSIDLPAEPPEGVEYEVMARSGPDAGRIKNVVRVDPASYARRDPSEEVGAWPLLVSARGTFTSFFAGRELPETVPPEAAAARINASAPTRIVVAGSADFTANNLPFMVNLADWMVQDDELIAIRSKTVQLPTLKPLEPQTRRLVKGANLLGGAALLLLLGLIRRTVRRRAA
ncbi:MAG: GldG family protein [Alphaproteobacteria bacterium]|nr:GldG family protein [Alphaproteobacteria bacterium]